LRKTSSLGNIIILPSPDKKTRVPKNPSVFASSLLWVNPDQTANHWARVGSYSYTRKDVDTSKPSLVEVPAIRFPFPERAMDLRNAKLGTKCIGFQSVPIHLWWPPCSVAREWWSQLKLQHCHLVTWSQNGRASRFPRLSIPTNINLTSSSTTHSKNRTIGG